jgi:type I restriction enzyme S subunit
MPQNWKTYKLSEIAIISNGKSKPNSNGNIPIYGGNGILGYTDKFNSNSEVIIIGRVGAYCGSVYFENQPIWLSDNAMKAICFESFDNKFLYYLLKNLNLNQLAGGSSQPLLTQSTLNEISLYLPPLPEQRAIASILSALDDKIELNLQMNKTLEEMAMALYKHWFVDFGPFKDGEFVESELGMIPKGWEVKKLGEIIHIKHGFAFKGDFFVNENRPELLLTPGNFSKNGGIQFNWSKQKFYSGKFPKEYSLKKGDLLIALTDLTQSCEILGAPALIPDNDFIYLHNQRLGLVELINENFSNEILYCLANTYEYREFVKNSKTGSTVSHSAPTRIYDYRIAYPSNLDLEEIKDSLRNLLEQINFNLTENKLLTNQRDFLLPKLISGEIRVKDLVL